MEKAADGGVFINGKAQIIEMLQIMPKKEKETLLKNIKQRNPQLAEELIEKSVTFSNIDNLRDHDLKFLLQYVQPAILGIALKGVPQEIQRRILTIIPRDYAESAYQTMMTPLQNEKQDVGRAQNKILNVLLTLSKKNQISLS